MELKTAIDELVISASEAFHLANEGRVARGYMILLAGLDEARESSGNETNHVPELWLDVITQYQGQFPREWYRDFR